MKPGPGSVARGRWAEALAREHLQSHGLAFVEANYRCRRGELDLVMRDGEVYVFVEVRLRARDDYGSAAESIHHAKRQRIITAAEHYLQSKRLRDRFPCRFDVVTISTRERAPRLQWIARAFEAA